MDRRAHGRERRGVTVQWKPLIYKTGPRGEEQDRECKHTIQSNCGKYRISRDKLDGSGLYTLWHLNAPEYEYASGTSAWRCIAPRLHSASEAKRLALDHQRTGRCHPRCTDTSAA